MVTVRVRLRRISFTIVEPLDLWNSGLSPRSAALPCLKLLERVGQAAADLLAAAVSRTRAHGAVRTTHVRNGDAGAGAALRGADPLQEVEHALLVVVPLAGPPAGATAEAAPRTPPTEHLSVEAELPRIDEHTVAFLTQNRLVLYTFKEGSAAGALDRALLAVLFNPLLLLRLCRVGGAAVGTDNTHEYLESKAVDLILRIARSSLVHVQADGTDSA